MSKASTYGFDLMAQLSKEFIEEVVRAAYWAGRIPYPISKQFDLNGTQHRLDLYLDCPYVNFCNTNALVISFRFLVRTTALNEDFNGNFSVIVPCVENQTIQSGMTVRHYAAQFANLNKDNYNVSLGRTLTFDQEIPRREDFIDLIQGMLWNTFSVEIETLPITPSVRPEFQFVTGCLFYDPDFKYPPSGAYLDPRVFAFFLNFTGTEAPVPDAVASLFSKYMYAHLEDAESKLAMPIEFLTAVLDQALNGMSFPADLGEGMTLNSLNYTLYDDHISIAGNATAEGVDADFSGSLSFRLEGDRIIIQIHIHEVDLPWYIDFVDALLCGYITRRIEEACGGLDAISQPLPFAQIFTAVLPLNITPPPVVECHNFGCVSLQNGGFMFSTYIELNYNRLQRTGPPLVRGHLASKEFHRVGCEYGDKIKRSGNLIIFKSEEVALDYGYDGCAFCYPEYDKTNPGKLDLYLRFTNQPPNYTVTKTINWHLKLVKEESGTKGSTEPIKKTETVELKTDEQGICERYFVASGLHPGRWRMQVTCDQWSTECTRRIVGDRTRYYRFTFGKAGCESAWL